MKKLVPSAPLGWNKTISDLCAEMKAGKRKSVGSPEVDWAREYERNLIPGGMRFPRKGDIYEALEDMPIKYMTAWGAPYTGGGEGVLLKGERIFVNSEPMDPKPIGTYAIAIDYKDLEKRIVPVQESSHPDYGGFYFSVKTIELNQKFKLVETAFEEKD